MTLSLAMAGLVVSGYLVALSLNVAWLGLLRSTGWGWVGELEEFIAESYRELLIGNSTLEFIGILLMVSLVPAVCEELAFRRGLQGLLASRLSAPAAVLTTALIFSAFHLEPFGLPTRFFLGISLGMMSESSTASSSDVGVPARCFAKAAGRQLAACRARWISPKPSRWRIHPWLAAPATSRR